MRAGYFSDLHTERLCPESKLTPKERRSGRATREAFGEALANAYKDADVIVAAGDIGKGVEAIQFLSDI